MKRSRSEELNNMASNFSRHGSEARAGDVVKETFAYRGVAHEEEAERLQKRREAEERALRRKEEGRNQHQVFVVRTMSGEASERTNPSGDAGDLKGVATAYAMSLSDRSHGPDPQQEASDVDRVYKAAAEQPPVEVKPESIEQVDGKVVSQGHSSRVG